MEELINKAQDRDEEAFTELMKIILPDLYRVAQARLNNLDDVYDAINETMIRSYENLKNLKHPEYFKTWITKILINECNKIYFIKIKQNRIFNKILRINNYKKIQYSTEIIDDKIQFESLIKNLSKEERTIMILYYSNKFTTLEISKILNIKESTIKSKLKRAKEKIKKEKGGENNE